MSVEEVIRQIRKQEKIINKAQLEKERLYEKILRCGAEDLDLVTVKEAARLLGVSTTVIYGRISCGSLAARRVGAALRVRKSEVVKIDDTMRS